MGVCWQPARPQRSRLSTPLLGPFGHKNPSLLQLSPVPCCWGATRQYSWLRFLASKAFGSTKSSQQLLEQVQGAD